MIFSRTGPRISLSGPKFDAESDFEVRLAVAPPKSIKNDEKLKSDTEKCPIVFCRFFDVFGTAKGHSRLKF